MEKKTRSVQYAGGFPASISAFKDLEDPRKGRAKMHYFGEVLFIALASLICQCEGFDDMEVFAKEREPWLRKHLKLPNGLPSDDTFRRVFTAIDPKRFNECFIEFARNISGALPSQLIAVDGKTVRHSFDGGDTTTSIHIVSAWAAETGISLGQLEIGEKSNEITAVPKLLKQLDIKGHTVSLDAMGCQKKIAQCIHLDGADYVLALKGNHGTLFQEVVSFFDDPEAWSYQQKKGFHFDTYTQTNKGHDRVETRTILATNAINWIDDSERKHWVGLKGIVCVESTRFIQRTQETSTEKRYYLTSHEPNAENLATLIRNHWSIENQCHWVLDVVWNEDASRIRKGNAAQNVALLRKMALNLLKIDSSVKASMPKKRLMATLNTEKLEKFLLL